MVGGGCQVTIDSGVKASADGSGLVQVVVSLDKRATELVPDLARQLRLDDLRQAGWKTAGPARTGDGHTWAHVSKPFASPQQATRVMRELSGPQGPFRNFRLVQRRSLLRTTTIFTGSVDLRPHLEAFGDEGLRDRLGGTSFGVDTAGLEKQLGTSLDHSFRVRISARLPGVIESNAPVEIGGGVAWEPRWGERQTLRAASSAWNIRPLAAAIAVGAVLALVMVLARHNRHPRPS